VESEERRAKSRERRAESREPRDLLSWGRGLGGTDRADR
jgi:hypothetical protein